MTLNKKNNIKLEIRAPMTSVGTLLVVDKGTLLGEDFANDETKNFSLTLFKLEGDVPVQIEISEVIAKSGNNLTLRRAVEPCPMNYGAGEMVQQAYDFDVGDVAYMNLTAGDIDEILEMIKDTNVRIDDVERDYVTQEQLELEKGTTIATLENGKIPGNQINTSTLEVTSLNQEFVAGEDIAIGTAVTAGIEKTVSQTERSGEYNLPPYSSGTITFVDFLTLNVTSALKYIKATFTQTYPGTGYSNRCQIQVLQNGIVLQTSDSFTIEYNKDTIFEMLVTVPNLIGEIQLKIGTTDTVYTYRTKYKELTLYTLSNKVYKYNPSELVTEYSGIAVETKNAGENIRIATDGNITTYSGLVPGAEYYINNAGTIEQFVGTSTVPIDTKVMAGIALNETILNINKNNPKLEVINITIPSASGTSSNPTASVTTINHNLQITPKNILIWLVNTMNQTSAIKNLSDTQGMFVANYYASIVNLGVIAKNEKSITIKNFYLTSFNLSILLIA